MSLATAAARQSAMNRFGSDCDFRDPKVAAYAATVADRVERFRSAVDKLAAEPGSYAKFDIVFPMLLAGTPVDAIVDAVRATPERPRGWR